MVAPVRLGAVEAGKPVLPGQCPGTEDTQLLGRNTAQAPVRSRRGINEGKSKAERKRDSSHPQADRLAGARRKEKTSACSVRNDGRGRGMAEKERWRASRSEAGRNRRETRRLYLDVGVKLARESRRVAPARDAGLRRPALQGQE
jgi:hypothetical protein